MQIQAAVVMVYHYTVTIRDILFLHRIEKEQEFQYVLILSDYFNGIIVIFI